MSGLREQMTDAAIGSAGSKIVATGASITGIGWLTTTTGIAFLGLLVTIAGFIVAWVYKHKDRALKLQQAAALARIAALDEQIRQQRLDRMHRASQRHAAVNAEQHMQAERERLAAVAVGVDTDPGPDQ